MARLIEERIAFLEETCNHYNFQNRCVKLRNCKYSPVTLDLVGKSEGCAIGRHLNPEVALMLDRLTDLCDTDSDVRTFQTFLPDHLTNLGVKFLLDIQSLHDGNTYWDDEGLTEEGKSVKETFIERIKSGHYDDDEYEIEALEF